MPNTREKNRRSVAAREKRRDEVTRLYLTGGTFRSVSRELGVSVMTVIRDMDKAREEWKKEAVRTYDALLPEKLAELNAIRSAAWEGWKRSLRDEKIRTKEKNESEGVIAVKEKQSIRQQAGDPRFLSQLEKCLRLECQLRGLLDKDAGETGGTTSQVVEIVIESREQHEEFKTLSMEQLRARIETKQVVG